MSSIKVRYEYRRMAAMLVVAFVVSMLPAQAAQPETTIRLDVPGAVVTVASGINGDGLIVGWYCTQLPCNAARFHGFILSNGVYSAINVPADSDRPVIGTQARYISPQGVVIGSYFTLQNNIVRLRGFAWYQGTFTFFDAPDWIFDNPSDPQNIIPRAINAKGDIVGCIHGRDSMASMHGFAIRDGVFSRISDGSTMNNGITSSGEVVGLDFMAGDGYHIDKSGNVERLTMPGADFTQAWDLNSRGEIVGQAWTNGGTVNHAFLRSKAGGYRFIDPSGALTSTAFGINSSGDVVGNYRDASGPQCGTTACVHGFLLQRGEQ